MYSPQISYLEVEVETLTEQLHSPAVCEDEQNGSVTVDDLDHIHRVNRDLEQQLSDKNRVRRLISSALYPVSDMQVNVCASMNV